MLPEMITDAVRAAMREEAHTETERIKRMQSLDDVQFDLESRDANHADWQGCIRKNAKERAKVQQEHEEIAEFEEFIKGKPPTEDARSLLSEAQLRNYNRNRYYRWQLRIRKSQLEERKERDERRKNTYAIAGQEPPAD